MVTQQTQRLLISTILPTQDCKTAFLTILMQQETWPLTIIVSSLPIGIWILL
nr:MAG TPA: hypothetical protein [Caudoviricetes sp.]